MATHRVLEQSFIDNVLHEEGAEIDLPEGIEAGPNLEEIKPAKGKNDKNDKGADALA